VSDTRSDTGVTWYPAPAEDAAVAAVSTAFADAFGRRPDGVWAAPGRVNLIGEHVDYNGGPCLPLALPHRAYAAIARRDGDGLRLRSAQVSGASGWWQGSLADVGPGRVQGWAGYVAGVPWALRAAGHPVGGFDVAVDSCVPLGSGLSSSASLECCVAVGLDELYRLGLGADDAGRARLAAACVRAENEIAAAPTGGMDQAAALRCTPGHALLLDCLDFSVEQIPFDPVAAGLELLVIDTRAHHALTDGQYGSRRDICEQAARALGVRTLRELADALGAGPQLEPALAGLGDDARGRDLRRKARHVVTEISRVRDAAVLLRGGRVGELGPTLDASHTSMRDDYEVSCPELDLAVETARAAGALGARMTGGGFGGSAVTLVPVAALGAVTEAVTAAFAAARFTAPAFLDAVPSAAAGRVG
jgi:galactokinase